MKKIKLILAAMMLLCSAVVAHAAQTTDNLPTLSADPVVDKAAHAKQALARDAVCTKCHDESESAPILSLYQTKHGVRGDSRTPSCQDCHGQSEQHLKGSTDSKVRPAPDFVFKKGVYQANGDKERAGQCLTCHSGGKRSNWDGGKHQANDVACNDCHKVHRPQDPVLTRKTQAEVCFTCHKDQRADSHKISSHPIDIGKVICSDCHNQHGSTGPKLMKKNTVNETCFQCHTEKRGPVLFEHQPVVEDCTNCHTPHGSNITPLLKSRPPFLCQECHDGTHASSTPAGPNVGGYQAGLANKGPTGVAVYPSTNLVGRACMDCHSQVHGSNSPAGGFLQR